MKVTVNIDCTPEEARTFMGLPNVSQAQEAVVDAWQQQALDAMEQMDPLSLMKAWMPGGLTPPSGSEAWEQFQNAFWAAMPDAGGKPKK